MLRGKLAAVHKTFTGEAKITVLTKEIVMRYMKIAVLALSVFLSVGVFGQKNAAEQNAMPDIAHMHDNLPDKEYTAKVANTSYVAPNGDRVLRHEIDIPASLADTWTAMSTSE